MSAARVCILGPSGRMGAMLLELGAARKDVKLVSAADRAGAPGLGDEPVAGVKVTDDLGAALAAADVYIDFTTPDATRAAAECAAERGVAAVIGTTGLDDGAEAALAQLARRAPIVVAPNFSLGVNVLLGLAETAARALGDDFDLEVVELHHKHKRDAPSGTAIALADALARGRDQNLAEVKRYAREGDVGPRPDGEIGVMSVRGGDVIGEHTAYLFGPSERIEITHRAGSRAIFAAGALRAAAWVVGKPPGRYGMRDVLGLS